MSEPSRARRIERLLPEIAQERNRIALNIAPEAFWAGLVINRKPQKRHRADHLVYLTLEREFVHPNLSGRILSFAPGPAIMTMSRHNCRADDQPEDRAAVIAAS